MGTANVRSCGDVARSHLLQDFVWSPHGDGNRLRQERMDCGHTPAGSQERQQTSSQLPQTLMDVQRVQRGCDALMRRASVLQCRLRSIERFQGCCGFSFSGKRARRFAGKYSGHAPLLLKSIWAECGDKLQPQGRLAGGAAKAVDGAAGCQLQGGQLAGKLAYVCVQTDEGIGKCDIQLFCVRPCGLTL